MHPKGCIFLWKWILMIIILFDPWVIQKFRIFATAKIKCHQFRGILDWNLFISKIYMLTISSIVSAIAHLISIAKISL